MSWHHYLTTLGTIPIAQLPNLFDTYSLSDLTVICKVPGQVHFLGFCRGSLEVIDSASRWRFLEAGIAP